MRLQDALPLYKSYNPTYFEAWLLNGSFPPHQVQGRHRSTLRTGVRKRRIPRTVTGDLKSRRVPDVPGMGLGRLPDSDPEAKLLVVHEDIVGPTMTFASAQRY